MLRVFLDLVSGVLEELIRMVEKDNAERLVKKMKEKVVRK